MKRAIFESLDAALKRGIALMDKSSREEMIAFVESQRTEEGLFVGRSAEEDCYYSLFGLSLMHAFGRGVSDTAAKRLHTLWRQPSLDGVHKACCVRCFALAGDPMAAKRASRAFRGLRMIGALRTAGGVGPYEAFAGVAAMEDYGLSPHIRLLIRIMLRHCRCAEGGYTRYGGGAVTAPVTAAALVLRTRFGLAPDHASVDWLMRCCRRGAFLAHPEAPQPDLLSTAVSLTALGPGPGGLQRDHIEALVAFVESCWHVSGGFVASPGLKIPDVEYTYYALLALGGLTADR